MPRYKKSKSKKCPGCDRNISLKNNYCSRCQLKLDLSEPTASNYKLTKDDWVVNALAFLHACGELEAFLDKVYSHSSELCMSVWSNGPGKPENLIDANILDQYDDRIKNMSSFRFDDESKMQKRIKKEKSNVN
jgi:hypothetical protein